MCGRYELNATPQQLRNHFGDLIADDEWRPFTPRKSYNLAPSQNCLVIRYSKRAELDGSQQKASAISGQCRKKMTGGQTPNIYIGNAQKPHTQ